RAKIDHLGFDGNASGLDLRKLEDVRDEAVHPLGIPPDHTEKSPAIAHIVDAAVLERFHESKDRRQWSAQFMRDIREEFLPDDLKPVEPRCFVKECDGLAFAAKIERRDVNVELPVAAVRLKPNFRLDSVLKRAAKCFVKVQVTQDLADPAARSEEHTSELQSRENL